MRSKTTLATLALLLGGALPALAATPFGQFGGKVGGGNVGTGTMAIHGWALDDDGVEAVDILVDGVVAARANYGRSRPGVTSRHPGFPDSAAPGFAFQLDTTRYPNGRHTITPRVRSESGEERNLNSRVFQFQNSPYQLKPTGEIEFPMAGVEMLGACNGSPNRRYSVISGYALDLGISEDDTGVDAVQLFIDGVMIKHSKLDCTFDAATGGHTDCYGLRRQDLVKILPHVANNPHIGFRFVLDVGALILGGVAPGGHQLKVRGIDHGDQYRDFAKIHVHLGCHDFLGNEESFGDVNLPSPVLPQGGIVQFAGWALDWEGVLDVAVFVDGELIGVASYGFPRPEVNALYPGFPNSVLPGWRINVDTRELSNGEHFLEVRVRDVFNVETYIGHERFVVANP